MTVISDIYSLQVSGNAAAALAELDKRLGAISDTFKVQTDRLDRYRNQVDAVSDRLKLLGESGARAALLIEEITDPVERARVASQLFSEQLVGLPSIFDTANSRLLEYRARLALIPAPLKAIAAGQLAVAAIAGGVLLKAIQAASKADAELARQLESVERSSNQALGSISKFAIGDGGLRGLALASDSAGSALDRLAENMDAVEDSGTAGFIVINNIKTAMTAVLTGPLFPLITGVRLLNAAFGEGEEAARKFNAQVTEQLKLEAAQEIVAERRKKLEDAIKNAEKRRLEGVKFRAEEYRTTAITLKGQELSTQAAELYTNAQEEQNKKIRENLALKEELIPLLGKEEALRLGLIKAEKAEKAEKPKGGSKGKSAAEQERADRLAFLKAEAEHFAYLERVRAKAMKTEMALLLADRPALEAKYADDPAVSAFERLIVVMRQADAEAKRIRDEGAISKIVSAEAEASALRMGDALTTIRDSAIETGFALVDLAFATAFAGGGFGDFATNALAQLGQFASGAGKVLFLTGLGLEAIAKAFPGGAIVAGLGLMAVGGVLSGLASSALTGGGATADSGRVIDEVRSAADRRARDDDRRDREMPPIILKIGTREFGEAIADTRRRGYA